ncbi:Ahi1 protein-like [Planoprotostelium fungivorum]|uniref:Ahi1 protein-like n=1 Tax=Planoprotostelium fungivorum TaxID=1890364 RepID=A0A2P6NFY8_9EUKA|nr:Ahi1 protein-like [Planoprotostelium fungivorum]
MSSDEDENIDELTAILIHGTDLLKPDSRLFNPVVRFHFVQRETGEYLQKTKTGKLLFRGYGQDDYQPPEEKKRETDDDIQLTSFESLSYDLKQSPFYAIRSQGPQILILDEIYASTTHDDVLLLIEIIEYQTPKMKRISIIPAVAAKKIVQDEETEKISLPIAWAFMKMVGEREEANHGDRARLQLYEYKKNKKPRRPLDGEIIPEVFYQYQREKRKAYPSTIYLTVKEAKLNNDQWNVAGDYALNLSSKGSPGGLTVQSSLQLTGTNPLRNSKSMGKLAMRTSTSKGLMRATSMRDLTVNEDAVSRGAQDLYEIPPEVGSTQVLHRIRGGFLNCLFVKFAPDGRHVACACSTQILFVINIYNVEDGSCALTLSGHHDNIYHLDWNMSGTEVASASSDGTAKIWDVEEPHRSPEIYQHTSYVYTAIFHPSARVLVTAGYDRVLRFWDRDSSSIIGTIDAAHKAAINAITFDVSNAGPRSKLYSGDAEGVVKIWMRKAALGWNYECLCTVNQYKGIPVNHLVMSPLGKCLLVQLKEDKLFSLDLRFFEPLRDYLGHTNKESIIKGDFSYDGQFIVSGSEDSQMYIWDVDSGECIYKLPSEEAKTMNGPITCTAWSPKGDIIAACSHDTDVITLVSVNISRPTKTSSLQKTQTNRRTESNAQEAPPPTMDALHYLSNLPSPPPLKTGKRREEGGHRRIDYGTSSISAERDMMETNREPKFRGLWSGTRPFDNTPEVEFQRQREEQRKNRLENTLSRVRAERSGVPYDAGRHHDEETSDGQKLIETEEERDARIEATIRAEKKEKKEKDKKDKKDKKEKKESKDKKEREEEVVVVDDEDENRGEELRGGDEAEIHTHRVEHKEEEKIEYQEEKTGREKKDIQELEAEEIEDMDD